MQVSVETIEGLQCKMTVKIPASEIEKKVGARLEELARTVKIDGFRPGKVPAREVQRRYATAVRSEIVAKAIETSWSAALQEHKLVAAAEPSIEPLETAAGKDLQYVAVFERFPEFEVVGLDDTEIEQMVATVMPADLDIMFDRMRQQHIEWSDISAEILNGHKVNIDLDVLVDGEKVVNASTIGAELVLGSQGICSGIAQNIFEHGIIGSKVGAEISVDIELPTDYRDVAVAGKAAQCNIKINQVMESQLPELDDAFARKFDIQDGGIDELRKEILSNMQRELKIRLKEQNKQLVFTSLLDKNNISLPNALVDNEIHQLKINFGKRINGGNKLTETQLLSLDALPRDSFEATATQRVRLALVLNKYITQQQIKADPDRVQQLLLQFAGAYDHPVEWINWMQSDKKRMAGIYSAVIEDIAVEKLLEKVKITEKTTNYFSVTNNAALTADENDENDENDEHVHGPDCEHHDHE